MGSRGRCFLEGGKGEKREGEIDFAPACLGPQTEEDFGQ